MFSLFDLHEIYDNDVKLHQFLQKYGLESCNRVTNPVVWPKCSQEIPNDLHQHRGKAHWRCSNMECRHRVPYSSNSLLEGCHLPLKTLLFLFYFWAHDIGANKISAMLGLSTATLASWSDRLRICVSSTLATTGRSRHWSGVWRNGDRPPTKRHLWPQNCCKRRYLGCSWEGIRPYNFGIVR